MHSIPKKILIFTILAYVFPFFMYVPFVVLMGGMTLQECIYSGSNLVSVILLILSFLCPILTYNWLNKNAKNFNGTEAGIIKLNKCVKKYELISFALPVVIIILHSILVTSSNVKRG